MSIRLFIKCFIAVILPAASCQICKAQFYTAGDDPANVKWYRTETDNYKIIYPEGLDSLAKVYGLTLERVRNSVGRSAGYAPGEKTRGKVPVILHAFNARSNGSVAWAPKRLDLFTSPQPYASEAMPWPEMLAIHEQRHSAQMQVGLSGIFRPFNWFFGEMFNGLVAGLWSWPWFMEGDAVVAETALSRSGRGRTADFLNYYMIAFDNGDFRNWNRWKFGSQRHYAPNYYAAGYMMTGGIRFRYGFSDVTGEYARHIARRPYDLDGLNTVVKRQCGVGLKQAFAEITDTLHAVWQEEIEARKPFVASDRVVPAPKRYTEYSNLEFAGNDLYAIKGGMTSPAYLIRIDSLGKEHRIKSFPESSSQLCMVPETGRLYWSENVPDIRWSQKTDSKIRYYDIRTGKCRTLTGSGRLFNPYPSPDGTMLCTTEYHDKGNSGLTIIDAVSGKKTASAQAPDTVQLVENVWIDGTIYSTGISAGGYGIYAVDFNAGGNGTETGTSAGAAFEAATEEKGFSGKWRTILAPQPVQIVNFGGDGNGLRFVSDRTGVQELYHLDLNDGTLTQKTSTRYGADDFVCSPDGQMLYYSVKGYHGNLIERTPSDSLKDLKVDFSDIHKYKMADELSRQVFETARNETADIWETADNTAAADAEDGDIRFSKPERYRKFPHLMRIHSWAPFYFDVDNIMAFSGEHVYDFVSLGAAALSQNDLGTAISQFGYSAHKDPYDKRKWRHSGHFKFTYSGLYPVIEASVDVNDRGARVSGIACTLDNYGSGKDYLRSRDYGKPYVSGNVTMYIPFNFSRGGWNTGLVPRVSYTITNDVFHTGTDIFNNLDGVSGGPFLLQRTKGKNILNRRLTGSARFYTMRPVAESGIYPRWGFGAEAGASFLPGLTAYCSPMAFLNLYGYLPGFAPVNGFYVKALYQTYLRKRSVFGSSIVDTRPRGLADNGTLLSYISGYSTNSLKLSAEYGIPIYIGDLSVFGSFMYIKRMVVTPHFDYTFFGRGLKGLASGGLFSAGATLAFDLCSFFWLEFPFSIGVTCSCNGGRSFNSLAETGVHAGRIFVGPVFSVDFK